MNKLNIETLIQVKTQTIASDRARILDAADDELRAMAAAVHDRRRPHNDGENFPSLHWIRMSMARLEELQTRFEKLEAERLIVQSFADRIALAEEG